MHGLIAERESYFLGGYGWYVNLVSMDNTMSFDGSREASSLDRVWTSPRFEEAYNIIVLFGSHKAGQSHIRVSRRGFKSKAHPPKENKPNQPIKQRPKTKSRFRVFSCV